MLVHGAGVACLLRNDLVHISGCVYMIKHLAICHAGIQYLLYILLFQFFERLELFAEESVRKHAELTERIRKEVEATL